ncbi:MULTISPECIES: hypothetical protein [Bizionia]|uniref:Uncharacterized protein n=1 Tax=Bizionia algoritergicola TaxID=291187 RepID=A0A5D0R388_9FLAO|nr:MULTISPECIES: hypothetical protein [Bizionia]OBX21878.1 hypothetical protein BAA08_11055 [Bizionia sp. APA-3]TYB75024.1 hypothetical protein ES675_02500 [Bizionia algoritergicola]
MNLKLETILGKPLEYIKELVLDFENDKVSKTFKLRFEYHFFGMIYNQISIDVTDDNRIKSVYINFQRLLNQPDLNNIISQYGVPNHMKVKDILLTEDISNSSEANFKQQTTKRTYSLKEGSLDDKPTFILWNQETFSLKFMLYYKQNGMQLMFNKND